MLRSRRAIPALAVALTACISDQAAPPASSTLLVVDSLLSPTGPGAAEPYLATGADGRVVLSWLEPAPDSTTALRMVQRDPAGAWSEPREVVRRNDLFVNWADFPSVVPLPDGRLLAHWLQRNGKERYAYEVRLGESRDAGATWSQSVTPHAPGIPAEHGFVTILPLDGSQTAVFWLDGSAGRSEQHTAAMMHLGFTEWSADGTPLPAQIIDHSICDCCQTSAAMTDHGPIVVYRDRTEAEVRDIGILRRVNGVWSEPAIVHADGWTINACPVNGPAVAAQRNKVAVAWFTGARDTAKVQLAFSTDGGATFTAPVRIDEGTPAGRVDLELLDDGAALVSWVERTGGDGAAVKVRRVPFGGTPEAPVVVSASSGTRASGFPRMTRTGRGILLAWTIPGSPSSVRLAEVRVQNDTANDR